MASATAEAHPNIAFIKYWGNRDEKLRLPANGSISMNLGGLYTRTTVSFQRSLPYDELIINDHEVAGGALQRVSALLDLVRARAGMLAQAEVISENNFPSGAGIASSASAFAALTLAACSASGLRLSEAELSRLARRGSGSACRSIPAGFVEWDAGSGDDDSYARSIAAPEHWDLADCVAIVSEAHKPTGSTQGHAIAGTSPLQVSRVEDAPRRLDICRRAILERDFMAFAGVVEQDSEMMHAVMMSSTPPLHYLTDVSRAVMASVQEWRAAGMEVCSTVDAGANVHVVCTSAHKDEAAKRLRELTGVRNVLVAEVGDAARIVEENRRK